MFLFISHCRIRIFVGDCVCYRSINTIKLSNPTSLKQSIQEDNHWCLLSPSKTFRSRIKFRRFSVKNRIIVTCHSFPVVLCSVSDRSGDCLSFRFSKKAFLHFLSGICPDFFSIRFVSELFITRSMSSF